MTIRFGLWAVAALLLTTGASEVRTAPLPSIAAIAAQHVEALGGRDRINAIRTISFAGAWAEGGDSLPMSAYRMRPFYFLVAPKTAPAYAEGFDGHSWEFYGKYGVVLRTEGTPGDATRRASEFDDPLVDYGITGSRLALVGRASIAGKSAYDILVTLRDGFQKHVYVDTATALILGTRQVAKVHAFGPGITTQEVVSGYRRIGGVLFSTISKDVDLHTGREIDRLTWRTIAVNQGIPIRTFSPPKSSGKRLATLLELLYADRGSPAACVSAYRGYRAHDRRADSNLEDGIEFIGHQMLKAGSTNAPIALLKANATDHPRSAAAQFSLGQAFQTAGNVTRARVAYRRALQLSPGYAPAKGALSQVGT